MDGNAGFKEYVCDLFWKVHKESVVRAHLHDLRNGIGGILALSELCPRVWDSKERLLKYLLEMGSEAHRTRQRLQKISDLMREEPEIKGCHDIRSCVR
jgi:signal transduction histidine kinase